MGILAMYHLSEREESKRGRNKDRNMLNCLLH